MKKLSRATLFLLITTSLQANTKNYVQELVGSQLGYQDVNCKIKKKNLYKCSREVFKNAMVCDEVLVVSLNGNEVELLDSPILTNCTSL